jgi:hypothetical protein
MKRTLCAVPLLLLASAADADPAYTVTNMTCKAVQAAVESSGSAILHYRSRSNPGLPLYSRYVSDASYCDSRTTIAYGSVPTADNKSCSVKKCIAAY